MVNTTGHLSKLVQLAQQTSSDDRRALLREVADLFLSEDTVCSGDADAHADDILTTIAAQMEESVRAELAERFADAPRAPQGLLRQLANDSIDVARPLLERSTTINDADLIAVAGRLGQDHLQAIARRIEVSEGVADAVVARGDDDTLAALAGNDGARLSRNALEALVDRSENNEELHAPLINRGEMPVDLLNEMIFFVEEKLRAKILERGEGLDQNALDAALAAARDRLRRGSSALPADYDDAVRFIELKKLRKQLNIDLLKTLTHNGERTRFDAAFAEMTGLDFLAARRIVQNPAVDPIAIACKAAGFSRADFVAVAVLRDTKGERAECDADILGQLYEELPQEAAVRAIRFWRMRKDTDAGKAA